MKSFDIRLTQWTLAVPLVYAFAASFPITTARASTFTCDSPPQMSAQLDANEWLLLPVVFHLHRSERWTSPESLAGVVAETQRIFAQAKIELQPMFDANDAGTQFIDVYFTPDVRVGGRSLNGVSFTRGPREVFVRDDVNLRQVTDCRPIGPLPAHGAHDGSPTVSISADEAEQARTLAHEITHQLGLAHRQDLTNLQASGTTGWFLNESEIATIRRIASQYFGAADI